MWQVCAILGNAICHWIVNDTKNETDKDFFKKILKVTRNFKSQK